MSTGGRRGVAIAIAIVLIGGAFFVRDAINGGESEGQASSDDQRPRLLCASELGAACDELARDGNIDVHIEPAATSIARLTALADDQRADLDFDGWIAPAVQPDVVDGTRQLAGNASVFGERTDPLARSPLVLVHWNDRRGTVLAAACNGNIDWKCLGDVAGKPWSSIGGDSAWGAVKVAHADPATSATGLLELGQASVSKSGKRSLSRDEIQDPAFSDWFTNLEAATRSEATADPVSTMLTFGPSELDVAGVAEAQACPTLSSAALASKLDVRAPKPVMTVDVVFASVRGNSRAADLADQVEDRAPKALARTGWRADGETTKGGPCSNAALPKASGAPAWGSLIALLEERGS